MQGKLFIQVGGVVVVVPPGGVVVVVVPVPVSVTVGISETSIPPPSLEVPEVMVEVVTASPEPPAMASAS